jgi:hypothetical protein
VTGAVHNLQHLAEIQERFGNELPGRHSFTSETTCDIEIMQRRYESPTLVRRDEREPSPRPSLPSVAAARA